MTRPRFHSELSSSIRVRVAASAGIASLVASITVDLALPGAPAAVRLLVGGAAGTLVGLAGLAGVRSAIRRSFVPLRQLERLARIAGTPARCGLRAERSREPRIDAVIRACNELFDRLDATRRSEASRRAGFAARESELRAEVDRLRDGQTRDESAHRARIDFLGAISHSLRTPLSGVLGMTELLLESEVDPARRDSLRIVRASADSLMETVENLRDYSDLEAGAFEGRHVAFSPGAWLDRICVEASRLASDREIEVVGTVCDHVPECLVADARTLGRVLGILTGNAIKQTARGEVEVDAGFECRDGDGPTLSLRVADSGVGIAPERLRRLLSPTALGDEADPPDGHGLGLAIVVRLVERMGGRIDGRSRLGEGTEFSIEVPVTLMNPVGARGGSTTRSVDARDLASVDDPSPVLVLARELLARSIGHRLRRLGFEPLVASSSARAFELATVAGEGAAPRAIVLDGDLPGGGAFELLERLRAAGVDAGRCILLSRNPAAIAPSVGEVAVLAKPLEGPSFSETLRKTAGAPSMTLDSSRTPGSTPEPASTGPKSAAGSSLFVLLAEDNPVNQKLTIRMLEKRGHRVDLAENGRIAVEMVGATAYDLVLMDVMMPEMDGLEATIAIRESERGTDRHLPIVALTANAMKGDRERCLESGMDKYLSKPIRPADLYEAVESFAPAETGDAGDGADAQGAASAGAAVGSTAVERDVFDRGTMLERLGDDEELLVEILDLFVSDAPEQLSSLERALETGEAELVTRHAHTLKGQAANIAANRMQQASLEVEMAGKEGDLALASELVPKVRTVFEELLAALSQPAR